MSTCSFLVCIFWYPFLWLPSHSTAVVRWKSLRIEKKLSFVAGGRPSWEEILTRKHKDMEMVTWLEKNGQLCESCVSSPISGEFQDSHMPLWEAMRSRWRMWKSMAQRLPDGFFLWSLSSLFHVCQLYLKGLRFFFCVLAFIPELEGPTCQLPMVWFAILWWENHKVMHVGFGMNSVYPELLGSMGTCQRSAGSLGIRLLTLRIWVVHRFFMIFQFHRSSQLQSSNTFSCKHNMFFPGFGVPLQLEETLWTVIW